MTKQPEQLLENNPVAQLQLLGYTYVTVADEKDLLANLKSQLEKHYGIQLSNQLLTIESIITVCRQRN